MLFDKILNFPFSPQEDFWKKVTKAKIIIVYLFLYHHANMFQQKFMRADQEMVA